MHAGSWTLARRNKASVAVDALLLARRAKNRIEFRRVSSLNGTYTEKRFSLCNISLSVVLRNEFLTSRASCLRNRQLGRFLNSMRCLFFRFSPFLLNCIWCVLALGTTNYARNTFLCPVYGLFQCNVCTHSFETPYRVRFTANFPSVNVRHRDVIASLACVRLTGWPVA